MSKKKSNSFYIDYWLIILSITLIRLPIIFGYRTDMIKRFLVLIPFLAILVFKKKYMDQWKPGIKMTKRLPFFFLLFIFVWIIALLRTAFIDISITTLEVITYLITLVTLTRFVFLAFLTASIEEQKILRYSLLYAYGLYIVLNLFLYIIGFDLYESTYLAKYPAQMLSMIGISYNRVLFPMADGINAFGILTGGVFVGLFYVSFKNKNPPSTITLLMMGSCMVVLLMTDARGSLLLAIITILLLSLPNPIFKFARWLSFVIPTILLFFLISTPSFLIHNFVFLNRPSTQWDNNTITTLSQEACNTSVERWSGILSNRPVIWETFITELAKPKVIHLIGYGYKGQVVSGIVGKYNCLFSSYVQKNLAAAHNLWLQLIIDIGYIGLIITFVFLIMLIMKLSNKYENKNYPTTKGMLAVLIYIIISGIFTASISPHFYELFLLFIFVAISVLFIPE